MSSDKPVIVIVHGAFQGPRQYQPLGEALSERGFTVVQPENPSTNTNPTAVEGKSPYDDAKNIQSMMEPHLAAGREIVVICHSYGGVPGTLALEGYQTTDRQAKGLSGGVKRIVYFTSFALPKPNMSVIDLMGNYPQGLEKQVSGPFYVFLTPLERLRGKSSLHTNPGNLLGWGCCSHRRCCLRRCR